MIDKVYVVPHTHWDREWYQDFQGFRIRLVHFMDELLETLEQNPAYRFFTLDGQTIVLDDYCAVRPENRCRLKALIQAGRIIIGPWYALPDEFLVSGESLVRNLLKGFRQAKAWGAEPMKVGYVPDMFGHNSQLPQILRGFGIDNAVLFRGFRGGADPAEIIWEGADGSRVLGLKLDEDRAYGDFYFFIRWPFAERDHRYDRDELAERAKAMLAYKAERNTTALSLGLDGVDHIEIEPQLPDLLDALNRADLGAEFVHAHLEAYLGELRGRVGELRVFWGEQRSPGYRGMNNWLLANVLSSRVHLKQQNHRCETLLTAWAEPWGVFTALWGRPYPQGFLVHAWEMLLQNHAHDSICGCSVDQVHRDMDYRFDQTRLIGEHMTQEALGFIVNHLEGEALKDRQAFTVFNPSQRPIDGVIEGEIALPAGTDAAVAMPQLGGTSFRLRDADDREVLFQLLEITKGSVSRRRPYRDLPQADIVDRYRLALAATVPPYGYATYTLEKYDIRFPGPGEYSSPQLIAPVRYPGTQRIGEDSWDNGVLRLRVQANGTLDLTDHASGHCYRGLLYFEDDADVGDGWNHIAPVGNEVVTSLTARTTLSVVHDGPLQTCLRLHTLLPVPMAAAGDGTRRQEALTDLVITTLLELRKGDPILRCRTTVQNTARDHRLRLLVPTHLQAEHVYASTPFDFVKRPFVGQDYTDYLEHARDALPHNGVVATLEGGQGLAVYSQGLYEMAARQDAATLALTLFRSTRHEVMTDGGDGGQLLGTLSFSYALRPFLVDDLFPATLWLEHQQFAAGARSLDRPAGPVRAETPQRRSADLPLRASFVEVDAPLVITALKRAEDRPSYLVRLLNLAEGSTTGSVRFAQPLQSARLIGLDEQPVGELQVQTTGVRVDAKPKQLVTLEVTFA